MSGKIRSYCYLRVAACLAIVLLHTANISELLHRDAITVAQRAHAMGIVYCMMWAVPVFIMVSGALLLDPARHVTMKRIMTRYVKRVFLALISCCILFALFDMVMNRERFSLMFIPDGIYRMFTGGSWAHLWYLYMLLGLYLMLPFGRILARRVKDRELLYLMGIIAVVVSVLPLSELFGFGSAFELPVASIYPFYFFAGYAVASGRVKISRHIAWAMAAGGTLVILIAVIVQFQYFPADDSVLAPLTARYSALPVVLQSVGIFSLAVGGEEKEWDLPAWLVRLLAIFDECGFGIYLLHMVILRLLLRYMEWDLFLVGGWSFYVLPLGVYFASCVAVWLLKKIPYVNTVL